MAEHVTRITTEQGVQANPAELREFVVLATGLATDDCLSVLPPGAATPAHVAHLTSLTVVAAETALRDQLAVSTPKREPEHPDVTRAAQAAGLDAGQAVAAAAVASADPLMIVEGAAGSGKTTMLRTAIEVAAEHGRASRVVAPTLRAAQVAHDDLGVPDGKMIFQGTRDQLFEHSIPDLIIETSDPQAALAQGITAAPAPEGIRISGIDKDETAKVVHRLAVAGVPVHEVRRVSQSLEDVFMDLTGRGGLL